VTFLKPIIESWDGLYRKGKGMMKAAIFEQHGGPEVLRYTDAPKPKPGTGEVRVRVRACAINMLDLSVRTNDFHEVRLPHILGSDISGMVDVLGEDVTDWQMGDAVMVCPVIICGECAACKRDEPGYCTKTQLVGYNIPGGYAEYMVVPASALLHKPAELSDIQAASLPLAGMTAYHMLIERAKLRGAEKVLIFGASGGVGSIALQICKALGSWTAAVTRDGGKSEHLIELGADAVFLNTRKFWRNDVKDVISEGFDLVVDILAATYLEDALMLLKPGGRLVMIHSSATAERGMDSFNPILRKQLTIIGSRTGSISDLHAFLDLVKAGKVMPVVDRVFPLEEAADAHKYFQRRQHVGKVVLSIA
jgi:NADPH:quinone reductase-like Zn-dependent oxidoreductase